MRSSCGSRVSPSRKSSARCAAICRPFQLYWATTLGDAMHLSPHDLDKLLLHGAGFLAQKRLARGLRLNYPEAMALLAAQLLEFIRDGRRILGRAQVLPGVPEMILEVQIEGTFPDGTKLVTVHHPIALEQGDYSLA